MKKTTSTIFILVVIVIAMAGYIFLDWNKANNNSPALLGSSLPIPISSPSGDEINAEFRTFVFDNFHGEDLGGGVFQFEYPVNWQNDGQYFSPIKIKYYDLVSVDAPVYFDLISTQLFDTSGLAYQIANDKRKSPDSKIKIDGKTFDRYDLIDYGSSGGESTGRVIIYLGPQITFGGDSYYLVFRWEENPLTVYIPGNDPSIFEKMVSSLKFL